MTQRELHYDDHICVCGAPAHFGFGPPLTRGGVIVWACFEHRVDVDRMLVQQADLQHGKG